MSTHDLPSEVIFPRPLRKGDKIAICSPAGHVNPEYVKASIPVLEEQGWVPVVMPHALGENGQFSGTPEERLSDIRTALLDPEIRAILCSRGGYGVVHIMEELQALPLEKDPKWVIGFSDISALHALMARRGIASIHSHMTSHLRLGMEDPDNSALVDILNGKSPVYTFESSPYDRWGVAMGRLVGGNLAVLAELINTPYDIIRPGTILFIEDVAEPIYKIERILYQLRLSGVLGNLAGLIVGQFTEYNPDQNHASMEEMISAMVAPYTYPVAMNVPIGHVFHNLPVIESAEVTLRVLPDSPSSLIFHRFGNK
ncbi:MAG: LD-carboxypeptidase [Muribaculaceae bacterium]|nr:LD-carboxypeptidase [Muribaculaceae bacterium]